MKKIPWLGWALCLSLLLLSGCAKQESSEEFAVYLTRGEASLDSIFQNDLEDLLLEDHPLISEDDLVSYDPDTFNLRLTQEAYDRLLDLKFSMSTGQPFVVCVGAERIYAGAIWSPLSSMSFDGVVILLPLGSEEPEVELRLGYPAPEFFTGKDHRADERILQSLERAGKLEQVEKGG